VARKAIVIKDHTLDGLFAGLTLRLMDHVGNSRHGVALPYNYWPRQKWFEAFRTLGLEIGVWGNRLANLPMADDLRLRPILSFYRPARSLEPCVYKRQRIKRDTYSRLEDH
jgi:hypothetical protein